LVVVAVVLVLAGAACGSSGVSKASRSAFVDARAGALCTVKTHSYTTQRELEATFLTEQRADIPRADEGELKAMLDDGDATLNGEITARVGALCG
jgi:hypothetical protein